jgi:hypothetical protein
MMVFFPLLPPHHLYVTTFSKIYAGLSPTDDEPKIQKKNTALVGSLIYLAVNTRPDISHAVGILSRFMACPTDKHWEAITIDKGAESEHNEL